MQYRKQDSAGDYVLGSGGDFFIDSSDAVAQAVSTRLALWKGEWFVDTSDGTPWMHEILGKRRGRNPDSVIKERILGTSGVLEIVSYSSQYDGNTRSLRVSATLNTIYGSATITETL